MSGKISDEDEEEILQELESLQQQEVKLRVRKWMAQNIEFGFGSSTHSCQVYPISRYPELNVTKWESYHKCQRIFPKIKVETNHTLVDCTY